MKYFHFALFFLFFQNLIQASDFTFEREDMRQGLSSDMITDFCQDAQGFVWISTLDGLNKSFDNEYEVYQLGQSSSTNIRTMCLSNDNELWLGTLDEGIIVFNPLTHTKRYIDTKSEPLRLSNDRVNCLLTDSKGRIWIGTPVGLCQYNPLTDSMIVYQPTQVIGIENTYVTSVYEDSHGRLFVGTWGQSFYYYNERDDSFIPLSLTDDLSAQRIWSFCEDSYGDLWIGTWGGGLYKTRFKDDFSLEVMSSQMLENNSFDKESIFNIIYSMKSDDEGRLWLGTDAGLGLITDPSDEKLTIEWMSIEYGDSHYIPKDIYRLFIDAAHSLWVGTNEHGVIKGNLRAPSFHTFTTNMQDSKPSANTFCSFWEYKGSLYAGVQSLGFGKYDISNKQFTPFVDIPSYKGFENLGIPLNAIIHCTVEEEKNVLWMVTRYRGLVKYDLNKKRLFTPQLNISNYENVAFFYEKDKMWLGTDENLVKFTKDEKSSDYGFGYKSQVFRRSSQGQSALPFGRISDIMRASDGRLWVSSKEGGVYEVVEKDEVLTFNKIKAIGDAEFYSTPIQNIFEDSHGNLWFGSLGRGLWLYSVEKNKVVNYNTVASIWGETVFSVLEDEFRNIWLSTNKGISCINVSKGSVINYTIEDGLQGNTFVNKAAYKDGDGNLYFGGYYGFNKFNPRQIKHNTYIPPLVFTALTVDDEPVYFDYTQDLPLVINYKQNSFSVSFSALSYIHSENNHYSYMLEGFDKSWVYAGTGREKVIYGQIPPGNYTFKVKGSNNNGIWNDEPLKLSIVVKKSPYKTILAYVIYFILFLSIALSLFYIWKRDFNLNQAYKEEQNERYRADKINQFKLRFFTNISHELLTPLSIISNAIEQTSEQKSYKKEDLGVINRNTQRLIKLINQLLDFRKVENGTKKMEVCCLSFDSLVASLLDNLQPLCEKKKITLRVEGHIGKDVYFDPDKLDKILHNLLSNAFKYTPAGGDIVLSYEMRVKDNYEMLFVRVDDSGNGIPEKDLAHIFERFYRVEDYKREAGAGIGLAFTKALISLHKGSIGVENNTSGGASFYFELPVSLHCFSDEEILPTKPEEKPKSTDFLIDEQSVCDSPLIQQVFTTKNKVKILLVEDNSDMRSILKKYLESRFEIFEAEHGVKALEVLDFTDIDLIVSDVMMPEMDGITLCKKLKGDINTSHIPVILTTAKRTEEDVIEGYGALADSYVTKPVNMKLLLVRIENILAQREKLRQKFSKGLSILADEVCITDLDKELMSKINSTIKDNISNSSFTVVMLHKIVGSSESVVFRKIKALSGKSPNQYIREIRINYAAQLLKKGVKAVEASYQSGFTDPSYFSACFKKQFGVTPSKYLK